MQLWYVDGEDHWVVDLNEEETAAYIEKGDAKKDLEDMILDELHVRGIEEWVDVYSVYGDKLYDIPAA